MALAKKLKQFHEAGMAGVKKATESSSRPTHYVGNGGYNGYERIVTNKTFNPVHGSASSYNYGSGSNTGSYTAPGYSSTPALSQAPTAPTFAAAPRAQSVSAAPRAKANTEQFNSKWSDELQAMYDQIANRPKFSYDQNSDPLYQQYAEMYRKNAQLAMDDTVARAASLTGGYGNSYAETAGQAMYNQQMDNLNQRALDLYYAALDTYDRENQNMYQKFNLAGQMYNNDYNAWRDKIADSQWAQNYDFNAWQADVANQQWAQNYDFNAWQADNANAQWRAGYDFDAWQANNENQKWQTQFDYDRYINDRNFGYNQFVDDRNYNYQLGRDAVNDSRYDTEWQHQLEREGVEDDRYADELAYSRWRDYVGDTRYADETEYARQQADLDRALQYYQAGYDPKTGGMSNLAQQQYRDELALNYAKLGLNPDGSLNAIGKASSSNTKYENSNTYKLIAEGNTKVANDMMNLDYNRTGDKFKFGALVPSAFEKNSSLNKKYDSYEEYLDAMLDKAKGLSEAEKTYILFQLTQ